MLKILSGAAIALSLLCAAPAALAGEYEQPPSFNAQKLLGANARGASYTVGNPVRSDGTMRLYVLTTPSGDLAVTGDAMVAIRIKELKALDALNRTQTSQKFLDAVANAGLAPVQLAGKLVTDPGKAIGDTASGVGNFFGGIASGVRNMGQSRDNVVESLSGASKQRQLLAFQYGVDPYTDYKPLADKLGEMAGFAAAGGLAVSAAMIAVPGAAGAIVSDVSTASTLNGMARDYSDVQLLDMNRAALDKLGVAGDAAERFLHNKNYTPVDMTVIVDALSRMGSVRGLDLITARAAEADSRDNAIFIRRGIELDAAYQARTGKAAAFATFASAPLPLLQTADGGFVGVFPFDAVSWTKSTASVFTAMTAEAKLANASGPKRLSIAGTTTKLAKSKLTALGWDVEDNARF